MTPVEVIRHARTDRLVETYANTIWALRFRCMSCHIEGSEENRKLVEKHGPRVAWFEGRRTEESLPNASSPSRIASSTSTIQPRACCS